MPFCPVDVICSLGLHSTIYYMDSLGRNISKWKVAVSSRMCLFVSVE